MLPPEPEEVLCFFVSNWRYKGDRFKFTFFFLRENGRGSAEGKRLLSRLHAQHRPWHGALSHDPKIMTAEIKSQTLNRLSHPGASLTFTLDRMSHFIPDHQLPETSLMWKDSESSWGFPIQHMEDMCGHTKASSFLEVLSQLAQLIPYHPHSKPTLCFTWYPDGSGPFGYIATESRRISIILE